MMTRDEMQPAWEKIVDTGFSNYSLLTPDQRVWFSVEPLTTGGIIDHYINPLGIYNQETIVDLKILGFNDIANMLLTVNTFFKDNIPPKDINERNDVLCDLSDEQGALLNNIEKQFWEKNHDLEEALTKFINHTNIGSLN